MFNLMHLNLELPVLHGVLFSLSFVLDLFSFDSSSTLLPAPSVPQPALGQATESWADLLGSNDGK